MEVSLESTILEQLSSKGVLAYVAVRLADRTAATTAALASLVRCTTPIMLEGLRELSVVVPGAVEEVKGKGTATRWHCGQIKVSGGGDVVQILDSERFRVFVDDLKKYWDFVNSVKGGPGLPFSMGGRDGAQIRSFLACHKKWTEEDWRAALKNRAKSVLNHGNDSRTAPLRLWVMNLDRYSAGPLDRWNKPVEGNGNGKAAAIQDRNSQAAAAYLSERRR